MKSLLAVFLVIVCLCAASTYEFSHEEREAVMNIPDATYEHIYLKLGDGCENREILKYYDTHRVECDSVELAMY